METKSKTFLVIKEPKVYCKNRHRVRRELALRPDSVEAVLKRLPFQPIEPIAYGFAQLSQPVIWVRMRLEQEAHPIVIPGHVTDILQYSGQSERIVTSTGGEDHRNAICFVLGVLVEGTGKDLCSAADEVLNVLVLTHPLDKYFATHVHQSAFL